MKHLLKIGCLVVVLVFILVSNSFARERKLFSPVIYSEHSANCHIRNIDDRRQITVSIAHCTLSVCNPPTYNQLGPGERTAVYWGAAEGPYYCNFTTSHKNVVASICNDSGGCLNVHEKYR